MKKFKKPLQVGIIKAVIHLLALFSLKACQRVGTAIGWLSLITPNRNRTVTQKNIELCFPNMTPEQKRRLVKDSLIETGKTFAEAGPMWKWNKDKLFSYIKNVKGEELLKKAHARGNGVILALPHIGNWELLSLYISANYASSSMYQKPKLAQLDTIIKHGRERMGAKLVPADNTGVRAMLKALKNNEFVCILPDQEPNTGTGVYAPFFGLQAYSMTLVSRLAKKTDACVIIAYTRRLASGEGYEVVFSKLPKMKENLISDKPDDSVVYLNKNVEKTIRSLPAQYQWSYKRFRNQPANENGERIDYYNP